MGGGGGAGEAASPDAGTLNSAGGAGGGVIWLVANQVLGNATFNASGQNSAMRANYLPRVGRRTARTFPLEPPPQ